MQRPLLTLMVYQNFGTLSIYIVLHKRDDGLDLERVKVIIVLEDEYNFDVVTIILSKYSPRRCEMW